MAKVLPFARRKSRLDYWQGHDPILIHRQQIHPGVVLLNFSRRDHGSLWVVSGIRTRSANGRYYYVPNPILYTDTIFLNRQGSNETTQRNFLSIAYSAVWRIAL